MFCKKCGRQIPEDANFCPYCDSQVNSNNTRNNFDSFNPPYNYQPQCQNQNKSSSSNGMAIAGFACSFFIPLLGLIFGIIGLQNSKTCNVGRGFSIAAIIISTLRMILNFISVLFLLMLDSEILINIFAI